MIGEQEVLDAVRDLLSSKPEYEDILRALLTYEETHEGTLDEHSPTGHSWDAQDVPTSPQRVYHLARIGIAYPFYRTNRSKTYCLAHPDRIKEALIPFDHKRELVDAIASGKPDVDVDDLFSWIIGYDDIKFWLRKVVTAKKPVHPALDGPPGTAKTAFLLELKRVPGARFSTGTYMSGPGIWDILYDEKPFIFMIDEFDKLKGADYAILDPLMSDGFIQKDQHNVHLHLELNTRVVAGLNRWGRTPEEIRSRMKHWRFEKYTRDQYVEVVLGMLPVIEETDPEMAKHIAQVTSKFTTDVREAIRYARWCDTIDEVDYLYRTDMKYRNGR